MSTVVLDTITGKSTSTTITIGSTPVVSASANSMTIRGEGSAQTSIQQGLGKTWVNFKGTDTFGARDSLNVTSLTDGGAGNYTVTIANDMANINYCSTDSIGSFPDAGENFGFSYTSTHATGSVKLFTANSAADANVDFSNNNVLLHGDLA